MADPQDGSVPRGTEYPGAENVFNAMEPCEPYSVGDLVSHFGEDDTTRWTIERRLETLHEQGRVRRKKHSANRVSWWVEPDAEDDA